ncbi:long-chain-fatty-acid--CoA ligase [Amycolatopsis saalfeldensis]|uniref:Fatty-acyl-CoA synthase n=1 Tax=Amycolatopsis saalfeldensis TaxID=394193 RepID=A0A1H8XXR3_9PSEU|nr:long-chain-fatty-acid--CoA ligase [Amycolatopsis saalfeldensis]SEP44659.1 fatty-acyl-CoA synthase [Amycolatopsis saalfeldensis]
MNGFDETGTHMATAQHPSAGLMMSTPLTTQELLKRMRSAWPDSTISTVADETARFSHTVTFAEVAVRAERLAAALSALGVRTGDRVGSLLWNSAAHVELYYAATGLGAVLHTINPRLFADQIEYTIDHAEDRVLVVDATLVGTLTPLLDRLPRVEHVVVVGTPAPEVIGRVTVHAYPDLLEQAPAGFRWPELQEDLGACLCYTSGTTGNPKGVLYTHRSIVLHALIMAGTNGFRLGRHDRALALVPMFHALGWGLPFIVALTGTDLVLPGRHLGPATIATVIEREQVTWAGGVPTLWLDLLRYADAQRDARPVDLSSLRLVLSGGTKVPQPLMAAFEERYGVTVGQGWGMTETLPGATLSLADPDASGEAKRARRELAGQASPFYEFRVVDADGAPLPHDGKSVGEIEVRGPVVAAAYYGAGHTAEKFHDGWLRTGDLGAVTHDGWLDITDRAKDAIKSGGEWISSQDLEAALMRHPAVLEAAVVSVPHERWSERPAAVVATAGDDPSADELRDHLRAHVAGWWIPDEFHFVAELPRNSTGKFDKRTIRDQLRAAREERFS